MYSWRLLILNKSSPKTLLTLSERGNGKRVEFSSSSILWDVPLTDLGEDGLPVQEDIVQLFPRLQPTPPTANLHISKLEGTECFQFLPN